MELQQTLPLARLGTSSAIVATASNAKRFIVVSPDDSMVGIAPNVGTVVTIEDQNNPNEIREKETYLT